MMKKLTCLYILLALCLLAGCAKPAASEPEPSYAPLPEMLDGPDSYVEPEPEPAPAPGPESEIEQIPAPTVEPEAEPESEPVPEPVPPAEPEPEYVNVTDSLTAAERTSLNVFLSNFSELYFRHFDRDETPDRVALVDFAYMHNKINSFGRDKISVRQWNGESCYSISAADVDQTLERFFGVKPDHGEFELDTHLVGFDGERYYFLAADGEAYNTFSVVNQVITDGSGTYWVRFDVYDLDITTYFDNNGIPDACYALSAAEAENNGLLEYLGTGEATLEDYTNNGSATYRLLAYDYPEK